jgi:hypothetical protein
MMLEVDDTRQEFNAREDTSMHGELASSMVLRLSQWVPD